MKTTLIYLATIALLAGCRGKGSGDNLTREQQQYEVVQEGQSSSAVTSTISAPGEVPAPGTAMTNTNADTTSNFALPGVAPGTATTSQPPGTLAGTMTMPGNPPMTGYPSSATPPRTRPSRPAERPAETTTVATTHTETTSTTSTSFQAPPPSTSTIPPNTDTAPPPPPREDQKPPSDDKPPSTDTQPPPTTTTTGL